jgi:hypothetical protein
MAEPKTNRVGGAKVTLNPAGETPTAALVRTAAAPFDVTDRLGRVITLKKPTPLASLDFAKAAGSAGLNQLYLAEVAHLKFVAAIDGDTVPTPSSDAELRVLYARLGDEGNEAAQLAVFEHFVPKTTSAAEDLVKNS